MPNTVEYKDWLFVKVKNPELRLRVEGNKLCWGSRRGGIFWKPLPPGSYQIIDKGDGLSDKDWKEIVERIHENGPLLWKNYTYPVGPRFWWDAPTLSGHSLLRSLEMEPGTTLVLKKQTKN